MAQDLTGLNSLRQALTPYEDVKFELNLNRHPKAHKNKSLIYAENMKLSNDGSVLENEEDFVINNTIKTLLSSYYSNNFEIIHIIPCNTELVLFVREANSNHFQIWRYREKNDNYVENFALFYNKSIPYNYGEFSGTFTYTSNDSLIIAFCEYPIERSRDFMSPMMTINLGTHTKGRINADGYTWDSTIGEFNDRNLEPYKLPICPEVRLPQINNVRNIKGNSYIGTYYVYIRYKINKYDYTQWFSIGYPIINEFKQDTILHKKNKTNTENKAVNGKDLLGAHQSNRVCNLKSYLNQDTDLINNALNIDIVHNDILYDYCQIGIICISKTYTKYFITSDIKLVTSISISTNINNLKEEVFNTNIYENYYNVKNIINKNNKLYISNYRVTEDKVDVDNLPQIYLRKFQNINNTDTTTNKITIGGYEFDESDILATYSHKENIYIDDNYTQKEISFKLISLPYFLKINNLESIIKSRYVAYPTGRTTSGGTTVAGMKVPIEKVYIGVLDVVVSGEVNNTGSSKTERLVVIMDDIYAKGETYNRLSSIGSNFYFYVDSAIGGKKASFVRFSCQLKFVDPSDPNTYLYTYDLNNASGFKTTDTIYPEDYLINKDYYFNNLDNYSNNNIITGLCKGEVYDFYVHFIDKYGHITDGYKLLNASNQYYDYFDINDDGTETVMECCFYYFDNKKIVVLPFYEKIIYFDTIENKYKINFHKGFARLIEKELYDMNPATKQSDGTEDWYNAVKTSLENLLYLPYEQLKDLTYGDIFDTCMEHDPTYPYFNKLYDEVWFIKYYNSKGELLFKVPKLYSTKGDIQLYLYVEGNAKDAGDYVSYFISHKKLEKIYVLDGFGTKNQINNILLNNTKFESGNIVKLYDIFNEKNWNLATHDKCVIQEDVIHTNNFILYPNLLNKLGYAEDSQIYRHNRQTTLYLSDIYGDFKGYPKNNSNLTRNDLPVSYLEILNLDKNKYINNKNLYRLGNIINDDPNGYTKYNIINGLNGRYDKTLAIKYGNNDAGVNNLTDDYGYGTFGDVFLYEIFKFSDNNELGIYLSEKAKSHDIYDSNKVKHGSDIFYEVIKTLNLFNYKITNIYDTWINFYNKFDPNNDYLNEFNRTIYRSQVISDEGRTNNWRWFENNAYKNVEENKGNIVNLLPIGNYLYVHTEHSLYAFSEDNTLSMNNQNLQVATPDIFDTEYKEVFISKLGYGGIQDKHAWVSGQFGYMWYNNDTKQIFKVYGNSMDIISKDIQEFLENQNIKYVRFANDIKNNRVLINIRIEDNNDDNNDTVLEKKYKDYVLSYNILSKTFISFHDYSFDKTYNTKLELYFLQNKNTEIHQFIEDVYGFKLNEEKRYYKAYFIVNSYYEKIKYLEYLIYKLRKRKVKNHRYISSFSMGDFVNYPVEKTLLPYPGQSIRVFNDLVDTIWNSAGTVEPVNNMPNNEIQNYNEPYWDLGNWNFNYLRDTQRYPNNIFGSSPEARLFGNYFVIAFNFGHVTELIEFESLDTNLTQDKNL